MQRMVVIASTFAVLIGGAIRANAQIVVDTVETVDFDRPESWALKYFNSTTLFTGLEMPGAVSAGELRIGAEIASIPSLTEKQQIVGYSGTKPEDLNKAPFFARPRATIGLPGNFSLTVAAVPPLKAFGITPRLFSLAIGRPLLTREKLSIGARMSMQVGNAKGAFTCPKDVLEFAPLSAGNPYGCRAESTDTAHLRHVTGELTIWRTFARRQVTPHAGIAVTHMNNVFNVNAQTRGVLFEFHDLTELRASGTVMSYTGGLGFALTDRLSAAVDLSYTPLGVMRDLGTTLSTKVTNEGMFNMKGLITYRVK
jgi:hypothetical protein